MKFDCGETGEEMRDRLSNWHKWFAWYPVLVAPHDCRWLELVERKGTYWCISYCSGWEWVYRAAK